MALATLLRYVWRHPLNADARAAALARVVRWQVASRLMKGPVALPFVEGTQLFATRGMTGATGNWYCGLHEVSEMAFLLHLLRENDRFVDVGANIGSYTVLAAGGVGARVTAVEPIPVTFAHLQRNIALNGLDARVQAHCVGLSDSNGTLRFSADLDTVNHVLAADEQRPSVEVPVRTLDELVANNVPTLMKIDVEGHEYPVLTGGQRTLTDPRLLAVIMETNGSGARYGVTDDALTRVMRSCGFAPYGYDPFARGLIEPRDADGNTVFVRSIDAILERVRTAKRYHLVNGTI